MQQSSAVEHLAPSTETAISSAAKFKSHPLTAQALSMATVKSSQLGVNVCCKDAFWYPSSLSYCIANDSDPCIMDTKKLRNSSSTFGVLRSIVNEEGAAVLWRGVSILLIQAIPSNVIYFIAYEQLRDSIASVNGTGFAQLGPLVAGGLARALASSTVSPLELLKTRLQSIQAPQSKNAMGFALRSLGEMIKLDGLRSLWSGLGLTLWRDVPFSSIYWLVVEAVRSHSPKSFQTNSEKFIESFISGIIGGVVASLVTTPFDVAKTRRQLGHSSCASAHMSMPKFMGTIARTEGWKALFVGLTPRTFKVAPACAIMITSYEMGKRVLGT
uniref:Mitochondrial Mtm1 n=1 Tax=Starmerella bombicola TaxID=75736 RepID=A0A6M8Y9K3_STABO|nr:mitochondrial Mtm1 [Starmerella bombicola]